MEKYIKAIVSNPKPLTRKSLPGDKHTGLKPYIRLYKVEDDDKYDSGINTLIYVKIYKSSTTAMENTNNMNLPMI